MPENRKVIRVFLASPGDLREERIAAKQAVDEMNQVWFAYHGFYVELVGWELTVSGFGRPQELINQDLNTCEYFLGVLYKRWGTPPDKRGTFSSGFEEEFRTSLSRRRDSDKPEISVFFKQMPEADELDPGEQLKQVLNFKNEIIDSKELYFEEISDVVDFQEKVRRTLSRYVQRLIATDSLPTTISQATPDRPSAGLLSQSANTSLNASGLQFLREFIDAAEGNYPSHALRHVDVARFRLFATQVTSEQADALTLGAHDANVLFQNRKTLDLSSLERGGLVNAGLASYEAENTPLWHWVSSFSTDGVLPLRSIAGRSEEVKHGALLAMRDIAEPLPKDFERSLFLEGWFNEGVPSNRKSAALYYLAQCGTTEDLPYIKSELEKNDYQTTNAAIDAIVRINLRISREIAFSALLELQPERVGEDVLNAIFVKNHGLPLERLREGLAHRSGQIRLRVVRLLKKQGEIETEVAEKLLDDANHDVRFEAMLFLLTKGRKFSEADAKKILVAPKSAGLLFSGDGADEEKYDRFMHAQLKSKVSSELKKTLDRSVFDRDEEFVLAERSFAKYGPALRAAVQDRFKSKFEVALAAMEISSDELLQRIRNLGEYLRKNQTQVGLDIICRNGDPTDLPLVREVVKSGFIDFSSDQIEYLRKFGEWADITLIISAAERPMARGKWASSAGLTHDQKYVLAAQAINALGRKRPDDLLELAMSEKLKTYLLLELSDTSFRNLNDSGLLFIFKSDNAELRKAAALKSAKALSLHRLNALLTNYISGDAYRFYNVILWLDLGVSMRKHIGGTVDRIIRRTWPEILVEH